jgi:ADP-heptose:LPS heptosyltransferase
MKLLLCRLSKLFRIFASRIVTPLILFLARPVRAYRARKYSLDVSSPATILISFFSRGLGDSIYFSGILKEVRHRFPKARIKLAILAHMEDYFLANPLIDELFPCPDYQPHRRNQLQFLRSALKIRQRVGRVDLLLNLCPTLALEPALWDCLIKTQFSIGIGDSLKRIFYDKFVPIDWKEHFYESMLGGVRPLGIEGWEPSFWIPPEESIEELVSSEILSKKAVVIAPGGKRNIEAPKDYCWTFKGFSQVIEELLSRGYPVILTGAGYDRATASELKSHPLLTDLMGRTTISQVFQIVKRYARLVVCNNSGLLHIASVLGVPTVSYADPQENMLRWGPYPRSGNHVVLQDQIDKKVTPGEFLEAILNRLNNTQHQLKANDPAEFSYRK